VNLAARRNASAHELPASRDAGNLFLSSFIQKSAYSESHSLHLGNDALPRRLQ